jgi:hypothetical protein
MLFKLLNFIKTTEDNILKELIEASYEFYSNKENKIDEKYITDINLKYAFSNLVRFFRGINSTRKQSDDQINNNIKEIFKGKSNELINQIMTYINNIIALQCKNINFSEIKPHYTKELNIQKKNFFLNCFYEMVNFDWQINIKVSNNYTNKVLLPEIILNFTLNDGKSYSFLIEYKVFQELRRLLTLHLKKIMENENILLLKNN